MMTSIVLFMVHVCTNDENNTTIHVFFYPAIESSINHTTSKLCLEILSSESQVSVNLQTYLCGQISIDTQCAIQLQLENQGFCSQPNPSTVEQVQMGHAK